LAALTVHMCWTVLPPPSLLEQDVAFDLFKVLFICTSAQLDTIALLPLDRERRVARRVAMAGRVDAHRPRATRGRHREKVVAARCAGCKEPILPADNRGDFDALPKYIHEDVNTRHALYYRFVGGRTGTAAV
jgi:ATP-dependent Lon protease